VTRLEIQPVSLRCKITLPSLRDTNIDTLGVFLDNAMNLIFSIIPAWDEKQIGEFLDATIFEALSKGLTSIHDAATELPMISVLRK